MTSDAHLSEGDPIILITGAVTLLGLGFMFAFTGTPLIGVATGATGGFFAGLTFERWGELL